MPVLIATLKAADANAYGTVERIERLLAQRPYSTRWDSAASTPNAESYLVNGAVSAGQTTVPIDTGLGTFTKGCKVAFAGHDTIYTVGSDLTGSGSLSISPALTADVSDNAAVERITANARERAIIWVTTLFDSMLVYNGYKTTTTQKRMMPRSGLYDPDGRAFDADTLPEIFELAVAEMVLVVLKKDVFQQPGILGQGISSVQVGPIQVDVDKAGGEESVIPDNVLAMLSGIAYLEPEATKGMKIIPLVRT